MDIRLTSRHGWSSTAIFAALGLILLVPLLFAFRNDAFQGAARAVGVASGLFWGVVAVVAVFGFWKPYYQYLCPAWIRWLSPLDALLYRAIGLGLW